jgi:repressor LexA
MPQALTDLERRVLDYLIEYLRRNTYQPSIREIGREFSIKSTKTVSELLQSLAVKGWIERDPSRSRGVRLIGVDMRAETVSVPVYGSPDVTEPDQHYEMDRKLIGANGAYLLPMAGAHLQEEGIRTGDLLLVEPAAASDLEEGDLVVTGGPAGAVQRCARGPDSLVLEPARTGAAAQPLTGVQGMAVRGRVSGVFRRVRPVVQPDALAVAPLDA